MRSMNPLWTNKDVIEGFGADPGPLVARELRADAALR
jgi:hypothetical protein